MFLRTKVAHRQPQHEPVVQSRVRQEYVTSRIDRVEQSLVERVELVVGDRYTPRSGSEAHDAERHRGEALEIRIRINPSAEELRQPDVLREGLRMPSAPK